MNPRARIAAGRILRSAGLGCMMAAAFGGLLFRASAAPQMGWAHLHVGFDLGVIATPSPSPGPSASPPVLVGARGGPVTLSVTGNVTLGERIARGTRGSGDSASTGNAGLLAELGRRTGSTTLRVAVPAGVSGRLANFGELQAEYSTPRYALSYGSQGVSALGALPLGATIRGLTLTLPLPAGEVSFYGGPAFNGSGGIVRVSGVRARTLVHGQLVELGYSNAVDATQGVSIRSLVFGLAATTPKLNVIFESALQQSVRQNAKTTPLRPSFSLRADYGAGDSYGTFTIRHIADSFNGLGSGTVQSEDFGSFGIRRDLGAAQFNLDEGFGRSGSGENALVQRRGSFSVSRSSSRNGSTVQLSAIEQRIASQNVTTWSGGLGIGGAFTFGQTSTLAQAQFQRATSSAGAAVSTAQYSLQLQRALGPFLLQGGYQAGRQTTPGLVTSTSTATAGISRIFGPTAVTLGATLVRALLPLSDQTTFTPLLQISRRISPSVTLGMYAGEQINRDRLNPAFNSNSRVFSFTLSSPFALGSGMVRGAGNPRLPATISGSVLKDYGNFATASSAISGGVANAIVVLDNTTTQRTDLSGRFEFQFVKPGRHEIRLEPASLPRGVTVDQPYSSIDVQGGQDGQVYFRIGAFGAVQGHIFGRDSTGAYVPLDGVSVKMDDAQNATTTSSGAFGFGRLTAGKHTVKVIVESLPANVVFSGDPSRVVDVRTGEVSTLDFLTDPLGSISGHVTFDAALGGGMSGGVMNAYVVANPGDHAAITNDDGSFIVDNLPAGTYTLDVDPETLPSDTGVVSGTQTISLGPSDHHEGVDFTIGHKLKAVVFSLHQDEAPASMTVMQPVLPPLGATLVRVMSPFDASAVAVSGFGKTFVLTPDGSKRAWKGTIVVPPGTPSGTVELDASVSGGKRTEATTPLRVDGTMPLVNVTLDPSHPAAGQYVRVRARFLAQVKPGDTILWQDGARTRLGNPIAGRVYQFGVKITLYPMRGYLLIAGSKLPIILR